MRKVFLAVCMLLIILFASGITCDAKTICVGRLWGSARTVKDCSECRRWEVCECVVSGPQRCPDGQVVVGLDDDCNIICESVSPGPTDNDNDGFSPPVDCDDYDGDINPAADEICYDGLDNDCDGTTDEFDCNCPPGTTKVNNLCVPESPCEQNCPEGTTCIDGLCVPGCSGDGTLCDGTCVDLNQDEENCGACGSACEFYEACCDGTCINIYDDENNCGACGVVCDTGETCVEGFCMYL